MKKIFTRIVVLLIALSMGRMAYSQVDLMQLANGAFDAGDYRQTASYLDQLLKTDPHNYEAYALYAKIYEELGQSSYTAQICTWGLGNVVGIEAQSKLTLARAAALMELDIMPGALSDINNVLSHTPDNVPANYLLANAQLAVGDTISAISTLRKVKKLSKNNFLIHSLLVTTLSSYRMPNEAEKEMVALQKLLRKKGLALEIAPDKRDFSRNTDIGALTNDGVLNAFLSFVDTYISLGKYDAMAKTLVDLYVLYGISPVDSDGLNRAPSIEALEKECSAREAWFKNQEYPVNNAPDFSEFRRSIANLCRSANNLPKCMENLLQIKDTNVDITDRLFLLCRLLAYGNNIDKALEYIKKEEEDIDKRTEASSRLDAQRALKAATSIFLCSAGMYDQAMESIAQAGEYVPHSVESVVYYKRGDYQRALESVEASMMEQNSLSLMLTKANILNVMGRVEESNEMYENVIVVSDEDNVEQAIAYAALGDHEMARTIVDKLLSTNASCMYLIAAAYTEVYIGNYSKAIDYLKKALDKDEFTTFEEVCDTLLFTQDFLASDEFSLFNDYMNQKRAAFAESVKTVLQ